MKPICFLVFFFCFSAVTAQKQYSLQLRFLTDKKEIAPNIKVTLLKTSDINPDDVITEEVMSDNKGVLNLKLSEKYFDKKGSLGIQAFYDEPGIYYLDYYEEISKKQFPFKKTVIFEHIVPPTLEEIDKANVPPPPMAPSSTK